MKLGNLTSVYFQFTHVFFFLNLFPFCINVQCMVLSPGTYNVLTILLHQYHYVHLY